MPPPFTLSVSPRLCSTPFHDRVLAEGVQAFCRIRTFMGALAAAQQVASHAYVEYLFRMDLPPRQ